VNVTYGAVARTMRYLCDTNPHLTVSTVDIGAPITHAEIVQAFRSRILAIKGAPEFTQHSKIVVVVDAITSGPGLYMPWQQVVQLCREEGAWSVVDAAHSIGQEMDINLTETKPDFWFSVSARFKSLHALQLGSRLYHIFLFFGAQELSQVAVRKARNRCALCTQTVRHFVQDSELPAHIIFLG
jgi:cysteine sulfinate desulfinase/cysteine desulfurase-like protein